MRSRQPRWRRWLIISALSLVIVLGAGYIGLNMAVDYVLKSMVAGTDNGELLGQALQGDVDLDALFGEDDADPIGGLDPAAAPADSSGSGDDGIDRGQASGSTSESSGASGSAGGQASGGTIEGSGTSGDAGGQATGGTSPANSANNASGNSSNGGSATNPNSSNGTSDRADGGTAAGTGSSDTAKDKLTYTPEVTKDKVAAVQESVTFGEKLKLANVLLKRLDTSDIDLFVKMLSGGMSVEEKREAKKIMLDKLTPEEYDELIQIAAKYGLSQGKSYEESLKEKS